MPDLGEAEAQLDRVVELARRILGANLLGVYLHGSAVSGGLRPDSDLDLLAVVGQSIDPERRRALVAGLLGLSGRGGASGRARPLEVAIVRSAVVRPWQYPPPMELQYGDWWRREFQAGLEPWSSPNPDLAIAVAAARAADRPLLGPPAAVLLDPVPRDDLVRSSAAGVGGLLADLEPDTRNVLLTLARIWVTVSTGDVVGKDEAARWAASRLDGADRSVIRLAGDAYVHGLRENWAVRMADARHCAHRLAASISVAGG